MFHNSISITALAKGKLTVKRPHKSFCPRVVTVIGHLAVIVPEQVVVQIFIGYKTVISLAQPSYSPPVTN